MSEVTDELVQFEEEEVQKIQEIRNKYTSLYTQIGQLKVDKDKALLEYDSLEGQLNAEHVKLKEEEKTFFEGLTKKYGDGSYDITTNTFTPSKKEEQAE